MVGERVGWGGVVSGGGESGVWWGSERWGERM